MWQDEGFLKGNVDVIAAINRLERYVDEIPERYRYFRPEELLHKSSPAKWSKQEILGHLVDSALNNLRRFTEIQFLPHPYIVVSYRQDELVKINDYQHLPLEHLLSMWQSLNRQIIYVIKNIPGEKLDYSVDPQYDNHDMKTLAWIICDYVAHMEHHFEQVMKNLS